MKNLFQNYKKSNSNSNQNFLKNSNKKKFESIFKKKLEFESILLFGLDPNSISSNHQ